MPKFVKGFSIILFIVMIIGSLVLGGVSGPLGAVNALYSLIASLIVFVVLYSIGYAIGRLDDIHGLLAQGFGLSLHAPAAPAPAQEEAAQAPAPETAEKTEKAAMTEKQNPHKPHRAKAFPMAEAPGLP